MLLGPATVGFLRDAGEEIGVGEGDIIVRRGERQEYFYVVIEGEVELLLSEGEGRGRPLARIGEGGIFGAESVLGKEGAAIDAVAVTDVRLLRYPASALPSALQESASLRRKMLGGIARQIHKTTSDALDVIHGAEVMARLVQGDSDPDELIAASPRMKAIKKKVAKCAASDDPILVLGEDGTGKTLIARLIHDGSERATRSADRRQLQGTGARSRGRADSRRRPRRPTAGRRARQRWDSPGARRHHRPARSGRPRARGTASDLRLPQGAIEPESVPGHALHHHRARSLQGRRERRSHTGPHRVLRRGHRDSTPRKEAQGHSSPGRRVHKETGTEPAGHHRGRPPRSAIAPLPAPQYRRTPRNPRPRDSRRRGWRDPVRTYFRRRR